LQCERALTEFDGWWARQVAKTQLVETA